nr:MAG TPA_asm: hypothetical protein [Caudoviricetes sp.]
MTQNPMPPGCTFSARICRSLRRQHDRECGNVKIPCCDIQCELLSLSYAFAYIH